MSSDRNDEIREISLKLAETLVEKNKTLAIAESCTGGWLSKVLTDLPGSSEWFLGGVVSYSNAAKCKLLHVDKDSLNQFGAVSTEVAQQMAAGAQRVFSASIALSTTGIAGPSGATAEKPVGLVHFATKTSTNLMTTEAKVLMGDRTQIRQEAVLVALHIILRELAVSTR
ncbi:MAG: nicotinamide-nucleotide amidohydrolase family protein [Cycloclasticus sp.]|nr:nicotinamide-nucleotide amidohydrolase family protein [Cycloclasticus sp.]